MSGNFFFSKSDLNIAFRYIGFIRELVSRPSAPIGLLRVVFKFWAQNRQFGFIVFDRLLQYRVINPPDVVAYMFDEEEEKDWSDIANWDVLRSTLERVGSRVRQLTERLQNLKKTQEARADSDRAAGRGEGVLPREFTKKY
jgi:nuclear cap-binding protein subunit 1